MNAPVKKKYSKNLIYATLDFLRVANSEVEGGLGEERVYAMLDAFDPSLKKQMLLALMAIDHGSRTIRIEKVSKGVSKISAIRAVRFATSATLAEAKDIVDRADTGISSFTVSRDLDTRTLNTLGQDLTSAGYRIL